MYDEMTPTERIGRAMYLFSLGRTITVRELSAELEISPRGTRSMLDRLSRVVPLVADSGRWRLIEPPDSGISGVD